MYTPSENPNPDQPLGSGSPPPGASDPSQAPQGQQQRQQGDYIPQQSQDGPQQGQYNPQQGQYNPQQGQNGPQQGQYNPQQGQYNPQQGQYQAPPAGPKEQNILGIVALAAAVLGFILTVIPATHFVGLFVLPIAFVLSLVGLFLKNKSRKWALVALIVSIVGGIVGAAIFATTVVGAIDDAIKSETTVSEPVVVPADEVPADEVPADDAELPAEDPADAEQPASGELGTRTNPLVMGSTVSGDDWQVTVNSFTPDATAAIMDENQFNDEPDAGYVYALVNVTVKRLGEDSGYPMEITVSYVTAGGNVVNSYDASVVTPDDLSSLNELYEGAEATGNVALMIPADDAGAIRISTGFFEDEVFFATS